jgi:hypothetical protein
MRDYLRWPGERTWFVDWARDTASRPAILKALGHIKKAWPSANVVRADINNVVETLPLIGFANLDFMSNMNRESVQPCIRATVARLTLGGILSYTWFRGREVDSPERSAWDVMEAARDIPDLGMRRWAGTLRLVIDRAIHSGVGLKLVGALEYQHAHSPMAVTVFQRVS